jgi:hypothetical protein
LQATSSLRLPDVQGVSYGQDACMSTEEGTPMTTNTDSIALRLAGVDEAHVVRGLAELDDAPGLEGPVLLALIEGHAVTALSLDDGRAVGDPVVPTTEAIALLGLRAAHLSGGRTPDRRGWRTPRGRRGRILRPLRPRVA